MLYCFLGAGGLIPRVSFVHPLGVHGANGYLYLITLIKANGRENA